MILLTCHLILVAILYIVDTWTVNIQIITVTLRIISLIYKVYTLPIPQENADTLSFPMMYHTVVYTPYSVPNSQFNNIPILVTMVTNNFPPKWFQWQPKSFDMSTVSVLASFPSVAKNGLQLTKLQSEVALFRHIFSKTVI